MHLLIDADSALYKAGCSNEKREYLCILEGTVIEAHQYKIDAVKTQEATGCTIEKFKTAGPVGVSLLNLRDVVATMMSLKHTSYTMYIGGHGNYRYDYFPEYKKGRKDEDKPIHLEQMKKHLIGKYKAIVVNGEEVDDRVSWEQCLAAKRGEETCIVTIDKDLDNTPGWHFNYAKDSLYFIEEEQALLNFARQLLTGDSTDGIPGIPGVALKTACKILPEYRKDWLDVVRREYLDRGYPPSYLVQQGRCLWMRRKPNELWDLDYDYNT